MNKPMTMIIKETQVKLANICNESGLHPIILDLIVQGIYSEIHALAEKASLKEELAYIEAAKEEDGGNSENEKNVNKQDGVIT